MNGKEGSWLEDEIMSSFDIFLIVLIFVVLIGFLVVVIVYGFSLSGQLSTLATQLEVAIQQSFITFEALVNSVVSSLQGFSDTAIRALESVGAKVGQTFGSVATFFSDQVLGLVENITKEVADSAASFGRMLVKGFVAATTTAADVVNEIITWVGGVLTSVFGLISRAFTLVSQFISAMIILIVEGVTIAITFVLGQLLTLIQEIAAGIDIAIDEIEIAIAELKADVLDGFATIQSSIGVVDSFIENELPTYLEMASQIVFKAIDDIFPGFMCNVLAPLCSKLPSEIAPPELCADIRSAGGC